jgi:hypothetical protein
VTAGTAAGAVLLGVCRTSFKIYNLVGLGQGRQADRFGYWFLTIIKSITFMKG